MKLEKIRARGCDGLYRAPETKIIYYRQFRGGREIKRSLKTTDIEAAKTAREALRATLAKQSERKRAFSKQHKNTQELWNAWVDRKETLGKSPGTLSSIRSTGRHLGPYFEKMMPHEITAEWWEEIFIPEIRAGISTTRKFFNDRKWLLSFLKNLQEDSIIERMPKLLNPDSKESVGKVYSDSEVNDLINFAQHEDLRLAILMAATMGMRRSEIFGLKADRVDIEKGLIRLRREDTKTRRARAFAISPSCLEEIVRRARGASQWIFPSKDNPRVPLHKDGFYNAWNALKRDQNIEGRFHDLRHTFLTKAFNAQGANAAQICAYAGVSLEVAERVYLHLTEEHSRRVGELVTYE